ncbi:iron-containing alcohol dehydrogenase [Rhizobium lusitanum]|uniref:Iron-containing alcohol dehydrogenase n=1 Tax=Rhizobium lusitanum TaxID=293958 RepID=A0A6L9U9C0_9HYPH|nr:iron-containing alcohol dehydrogenase [Rhizobium lusitanum]NEI72565.1 iron-containing alcohol dehydrogenase [Rhizobium lusitanum]
MMTFQLCNPTEIRFGKGQIATVGDLVPTDARILLLYGGGSIKTNGVYDQVMTALADRPVEEFGGVEVNPYYETLQQAARIGREKGVSFVLGVGGGSVIDAAKFLAAMIATGLDDPWDRLAADPGSVVPLPNGAILTLPATGSESNPVSVISSTVRSLKIPFASQAARPRFAIMDPTTMLSLGRRQLENGAVDAFTHVLEQYLTLPVNAPVQYGFSETLLKVLIEWGPKLIETRSEEACENVMWAANQALNGLIGAGVPQDWSTHMIGHAITALHGIDHARTLTMIMPSLLRYKLKDKSAMLARYARNVWEIDERDDGRAAELAIERTEDFMARMSCPVRISQAGIELDPQAVLDHLQHANQTSLGERADIKGDDVRRIIAMAA